MANNDLKGYTPTIGIECHVQLKTKTKLFSAVSNDAREAAPNTLISHIDLGLPGALPVLNEKALELGMRAAFALNTEPQRFHKFDRKHYFYPDLPMGYQITQFYNPIIQGGSVTIWVNGVERKITVHEAHLESDAGKSIHPNGQDYSLVDLNRAGTPLLEIVSGPDMHTPEEARQYVRELWLLMRYAGVSEADLYHGNMRFDVNVSVSKDPAQLGTRSETKNLNSFRSVEKVAEYEIQRQIELLENGQSIVQETRGWDEAKQKTVTQRTKEEAHDYRYMPDPDIPPIEVDEATVASLRTAMPVLPAVLREKLHDLKLDSSTVETIVEMVGQHLRLLPIVMAVLEESSQGAARKIFNWLAVDLQGALAGEVEAWRRLQLTAPNLIALAQMVDSKQLSSTAAKAVLLTTAQTGEAPLSIAEAQGLLQVSDESAIADIVSAVITDNPKAAEDLKNGEMKAIGFLVGQVMQRSQGKANPQLAQDLIKRQLGL